VKPHSIRPRGFTLIELLLVIALIAVATGMATLALRDPSSNALENEAGRLAALLESARAQSRSTGTPVSWVPRGEPANNGEGFHFVGLSPENELPRKWQAAGVTAEVIGSPSVVLGPEPIIGPQRITLSLNDRRLVLTTDGLGPFVVSGNEDPAP
jgi:general secretion pathway protein H